MEKIQSIVLSAVVMFFVFVLGGGAGVFYQSQKDAPQIQKSETIINALTSKVFSTAMAYGEISNIDGANVALSYEGDTMTVVVTGDTKIYSYMDGDKVSSARRSINLADLKTGDNVSVTVTPLSDGTIRAEMLVVLQQIINNQ